MAHRNPKAKSNNKPKSGNERKGNINATKQARRNLVNTGNTIVKTVKKVTGGGSSTPASSITVPTPSRNIPRVTPRGNSLVQLLHPSVTNSNLPKRTKFEKQNRFLGFLNNLGNAKPYQFNPYDEINKTKETWEHLTDKEYNSSPERQAELKVMQNYRTSPAVVDYATQQLQHTDWWFIKTDKFGDAVLGSPDSYHSPYNNFIDDYLNVDDYDLYVNRFGVVQDWFDKYTVSRKVYDPARDADDPFKDPFGATDTIDPNAPLPPWVENTPENQERWATYLHRSDKELDMINEQGAVMHEQLKQQAQDDIEMQEKNIEGKIGNASAEFNQVGVVNSLSDAIAASLTMSSEETNKHYFRDYIRDYWVNPLRTGHFGRFLSNRLMGAMDIVDLPTKGIRAMMASQPHALYDGRQMFEGQNTFVYSGGEDMQKQLMEAGGRELLNSNFQLAQGYNPNASNAEDAKQRLIDAGLWEEYQKFAEEYRNYIPETSALDNLKAAYTTPGLDFWTHTGNLGKDIAVDVMLDPTLILGGGARALAKQGAKSIARASVEQGLNKAIGLRDAYRYIDKDGQRAIEGFITRMDSKTIIFKNQDKIEAEVDALTDRLMRTGSGLGRNEKDFKDAVKSAINNHITNTNAAIVATSKKGRNKAQEAFLKTVYNIGYFADRIDSSLLKLSFPEPFIMRDTIRASKWAADNTTVGKYFSTIYYRHRQSRLDAGRQLFGDEYTGVKDLNLDQIEHFKNINSDIASPDIDTQFRAMGAADAKLKSMGNNCDTILHDLRRGNISPEEAQIKLQLELQYFAGKEVCNSLDQLDTIVKNRFDGFFGDSYTKFKLKYKEVEDFIEIRNANTEVRFLDELEKADDVDKLFNVLKKYNDHLDYANPDLIDRIVLKYNKTNISTDQLQEIFTRIRELPKSVFTTKSDDISVDKIYNSIGKKPYNFFETNAVDDINTVRVLSGNVKHSRKELKAMLDGSKYVNLKAAVDNLEIKGFQRLRQILNGVEDFTFETSEIIDVLNHTFYDVQFANKFIVPEDIDIALREMYDLRVGIEQSIKTPLSANTGAVYRFQLDRMVMFDRLMNDERIRTLFNKYEEDLRPILEGIDNGTLDSLDMVNHGGFVKTLRDLQRKIEATKVFYSLDAELSEAINPYQKYAILDYIFGLSTKNNEHLLEQMTNSYSNFSRGLETAIYSSYGEAKIGIKNARIRMQDFSNDIWGKYADELNDPSNADLRNWVRNITEASTADPQSYINLQILQSILLDPDAIKHYNETSKYRPVVFMHCSTSGLSPNNSSITGIGYKQWSELSEEASLRDIFEKIINKDNESIRVAMDDSYFDNISEEFLNSVFDSHLALRYSSYEDKLKAYKELFGGKDKFKSEADVVQEFCSKLHSLSFTEQGILGVRKVQSGAPCLVVHDFEGFNLPFLSKKVDEYSDLPGVEDVQRSFSEYNRVSENSFDKLRTIVNDQTLTEEEKDAVAKIFIEKTKELSELGNTFKFLDLQNISQDVQTLNDYVMKGLLDDTNDPVLKQVADVFGTKGGIADTLPDVHKACYEMKEFSQIAEQHVLFRNSTLSTVTNPIRELKGSDPLQYLLNMKAKYDISGMQPYFKVDFEDWRGLKNIRLSTLEKMSDLSKYVIENKKLMAASAEDFLISHKASFDRLISELVDWTMEGSLRVQAVGKLNSLEYVSYLKTIDAGSHFSAVESYLVCKKLYEDILKYYDRNVIKSFNANTFGSDRFIEYLSIRFVDAYSNPLNDAVLSKLFNGDMGKVLRGEFDGDIWHSAVSCTDGVADMYSSARNASFELLEKVGKAQVMRKVFRDVRHKLRDIMYLDNRFISRGVVNKVDHKQAMLYQHIADFCERMGKYIEDYDFLEMMDGVRTWRKNYAQFYSLRKLMKDGVFDKQRLLNELLWNDCGLHVVYPSKYTADLEDEFVKFVSELDDPFIGMKREGGALIVYIRKGFEIQEDTVEGYRYLKGYEGMRSVRNEYNDIPFPEYEEIISEATEGIFRREDYNMLKTIYKDIDYFSDGASIGTLGNKLSERQLTEFFNKIPNTFADMAVPNALRQQDMYKSLVCDPGFIAPESNIFKDILDTFEHLERTAGDVKLTANFIFGEHSDVLMKDILADVSNKEALEYLKQVDDYTIVQIRSGDTHSGMFLDEIKPKTEADIDRLRNSDAAIIPFELYVEMQSRMNYKEVNSVMAVFNKALVAFKAVQLCKPGTWVRNYVDAITKAVLAENEGNLAGAMQMATRGHRAIKEVPTIMNMQRREGAYITEAHWPELCKRYHLSDITWEDYQLLSGLLDRKNIINTPVHAAHLDEGLVSGKTVNFSDLKDDDIVKVWKKKRFSSDPSVKMDVKLYNQIRNGKVVPSDALQKQYNEVTRKVFAGLAEHDKPLFDKAIDKIFVPFSVSEVSARYAQMLWLRDLGYTHNQAVKRVADTQFRTLPNAHLLNKMEMIVPFATFKYNNALFWIKQIERRPEYFKLFEHVYGNIAETNYEQAMQEYGGYSLEEDYMLNSGGIPIGGSGLYFKLDPSCMDFFKIFYGGPTQGIKGLNPLLQYGFKYSMYELGYSNEEFLQDLDYKYNMNTFIKDTVNLMPGLNRIYDFYNMRHDKSFLYENAPNLVSSFMVKWFPTIFGTELDFKSRAGSDFDTYQASLAKDGLWYDCNLGKVVPLSEKNEIGANDPRINWDDVVYYMMLHFNKAWDSNLGKFVPATELTEGGLNQEFDFENDPDAWDNLCAEYRKKGKVFDYNTRHFVDRDKLTSGGLNDPDLSFKERTRLYKELFNLDWDANQNKYVDAAHYIPGGLNSISGLNNYGDWNRLKAYRSALYGEEYKYSEKDGKKKFIKTHEPICVTLEELLQKSTMDDDYYQYVAVSRMTSVDFRDCKIEDGIIKTADGRFVLTHNENYNNRVLSQFDGGINFRPSWHSRNWRSYQRHTGRRFYDTKAYRGVYSQKDDFNTFYKYSFQYKGEALRANQPHRIHKATYGRVIPYGGPYTKFSFYTR